MSLPRAAKYKLLGRSGTADARHAAKVDDVCAVAIAYSIITNCHHRR